MDTTYLREDEKGLFKKMEDTPDVATSFWDGTKRDWKPVKESLRLMFERLIEERKKNDTMHDALWQIYNWSRAYPLDVFIEPKKEDWARANEILEKSGINFSALNGATMRHVVNGIGKHARGGLGLSKESVK